MQPSLAPSSPTSFQLPLLRGRIALEDALENENDIRLQLSYPAKRLDFFFPLLDLRKNIEQLVSSHLGVPQESCKVATEFREWVHGSFNACIPVYINDTAACPVKKVFVRLPLPYKVGESQYPGNGEEKLRCEAATYIWIADNCPDVPIPRLRGFGFPSGQSFTAPRGAPLFARLAWSFRRILLSLLGHPVPSHYVGRPSPRLLEHGYLIVDCVQEGEMLSNSWLSFHHDQDRRANLFAGISRIMLSLARTPFPCIGSLTVDDNGVVTLKNRPLTCNLQQLENAGIPTGIPRDLTYTASDAYYSDLIGCQDNRMQHMPNSIIDVLDGHQQLSALVMMRALLPQFTDRNLRHGPFVMMLTDLHQSNIFVDTSWNITSIIDLEWACNLPIEMQHSPHWLTGEAIDNIRGEKLELFESVHTEFSAAFEKEERLLGKDDIPHTRIMREGWRLRSYWYFSALDCLNGLWSLYVDHIRGIFDSRGDWEPEFDRKVSAYWSRDTAEFIDSKIRDKESYSQALRQLFEEERLRPTGE